jgi:RNA polymerase sigma-70 factor, ECF subfamily
MNPSNDSFSEALRERAARIAELGASAVGGLYDMASVRLVRYAATITRNQHDAEDAVAACLLKVVVNAGLLASAKSPWLYLLRMVRNEALLILRRKRRWSLAQGLIDLVTWTRVDELEREDSIREVWIALRKLPTEQSEVVVLKIWEEFTFQQIGELLGVPPATAASRYRAAILKLSRELDPSSLEVTHE